MAFQMFKILSVALLSFYWVELIIGTPTGLLRTSTNFEERREDNLENGDPLTEEELTVNLFSNKAENVWEAEKSDLLPWDEQDPELEEGDILPSSDKNALVDVNKHWPNAQVPYVISSNFNSTERSVIGYAMSVYHKNTCIRFIPRKLQANFISIRKFSTGCSSSVGMVGRGVQYVNLNESCISRSRPGTVMHELMHALGFGHEQARPDRDDYVTINFENIKPGHQHNFRKYSTHEASTQELPYDYASVMHYPTGAFALNKNVTVIQPLNLNGSTPTLGQRKGFSDMDFKKLNTMYCQSTE